MENQKEAEAQCESSDSFLTHISKIWLTNWLDMWTIRSTIVFGWILQRIGYRPFWRTESYFEQPPAQGPGNFVQAAGA